MMNKTKFYTMRTHKEISASCRKDLNKLNKDTLDLINSIEQIFCFWLGASFVGCIWAACADMYFLSFIASPIMPIIFRMIRIDSAKKDYPSKYDKIIEAHYYTWENSSDFNKSKLDIDDVEYLNNL